MWAVQFSVIFLLLVLFFQKSCNQITWHSSGTLCCVADCERDRQTECNRVRQVANICFHSWEMHWGRRGYQSQELKNFSVNVINSEKRTSLNNDTIDYLLMVSTMDSSLENFNADKALDLWWADKVHIPSQKKESIPYRYKFLRVIKFRGFWGHKPNCEKNHGEIFVRLRPCKKMCCRWARQVREWRSFVTFVQPLTTEEKLRVLFFFAITCSLTHEYHHTTIIRKECGNYTHNKSAKIKTFKNLIIKFQQKHKIFNPTKFCTYGMQNGLPVHVAQQQVTLNWKLKKQTCLLTGISG